MLLDDEFRDKENNKVSDESIIKENDGNWNIIDSTTIFNQESNSSFDTKELNDIQSLKVAFRLSKQLVIRNLGLHLGIEGYTLDTIFEKNN